MLRRFATPRLLAMPHPNGFIFQRENNFIADLMLPYTGPTYKFMQLLFAFSLFDIGRLLV